MQPGISAWLHPFLSILLLDQLYDQLGAGFQSQCAAAQCQLVILNLAPFLPGVIPVIAPPPVVSFLEHFLRAFALLHLPGNPFYPCLDICPDKNIHAVLPLPEHIIGASAHNDAGAFRRQLFDELALLYIDLIVQGQTAAELNQEGIL